MFADKYPSIFSRQMEAINYITTQLNQIKHSQTGIRAFEPSVTFMLSKIEPCRKSCQ